MDPPGNGRYPSPGPSSAQASHLPFYQHNGQPDTRNDNLQHNDQHHHGQQQHHADATQSPGAAPHASHHEVPDDPALRSQLASMMGNFGAAFATPAFNPTNGGAVTTYNHSIGNPERASSHDHPSSSTTAAGEAAADKRNPRTKVSRACDECRRKKIRCDAVDESGAVPCTTCARTGARCAFSRQPLKRGPSKGYIKELAERLNTLERQVHPSSPSSAGQAVQGQVQVQEEIARVQREMAEGLSAFGGGQDGGGGGQAVQQPSLLQQQVAVDPRVGEKRSHAVAEMLQNEMRPGPLPAHSQAQAQAAYGTPQRPGQPLMQQQPFWRHGGNENRQESTAYDIDASTTITNFDWDEDVIEEYYRLIHQTFPLLPNNKNRLRQRLADCPTTLREAFLAALDCLVRTFPTTALPPNANYSQALKKAGELLAKYPFDNPSSHTNATNLVYLQTLLLMALESDNHGPATIRGQAGPSRAEWLGRAAGVAGQLEINVIRGSSTSIMEGDRDSEERLARRVWWVLFILDRWHASSTADLLKLPENSVVLHPEDQMLLGESTYHLARLSFIIGHLASILTTTKTPSTDVMAPSNPASSLLGLTLAGEIDRFRESVESVWGSLNLVHLSYHHCHLLIKRLNPTSEPAELCGHAVKVATVLNSRLTPVTPLNHHFGALAAMTLCELADVPRTRADALRGLDHLRDALGEGRGLAGKQESEGWDGAVRELVVRKLERMRSSAAPPLEGLADAAAAASASSAAESAFDPTMLTRYGYLTALGQGRFRIG